MGSAQIEYRPIENKWSSSLREAVGSVEEERLYLNTVEAFSLDETQAFVKFLLDGGGIQIVALDGTRVVGWCDVVRHRHEGTRHSGVLGMGVVRDYRQQEIGPNLLERALEAAGNEEIERVELEVFSSNDGAIRLYERSGFKHEGRKRRARILDGLESDILLMAKFLQ